MAAGGAGDAALLAQLEAALVQSSTASNAAVQRQAEKFVETMEKQSGFALILVKIMQASTNNVAQQAAAIAFKNHIRAYWTKHEDKPDPLGDESRETVRRHIVDLMLQAPAAVQRQVGEAVTIIADHDFPERWDYLLQDLLKRMDPLDNAARVHAILMTAHSIFKRYRSAYEAEPVVRELLFVLEQFAAPLLQIMQATDAQIEQVKDDPRKVLPLFDNLFLEIKIFYSLNALDLPDYFADNMPAFMNFFSKYLTYSSAALEREHPDDESGAGRLERVRAAIVEVIGLYAHRYHSDFPMLGNFIDTIWQLLVHTSLATKNDVLVSSSIQLLTTVARMPQHREQFANPATLGAICERIIIPNLQMRESDLETYTDNPMEYIRKDLEGSDFETRRRSASELVRVLAEELDGARFSDVLVGYCGALLQQYQASPTANWQAKDTAITVFISLAMRATLASRGVSDVNPRVNVQQYFAQHIQPELLQPVSASHPVIHADALKFMWLFRLQLGGAAIMQTFPSVLAHLQSRDVVVHTYAAVLTDALQTMKGEHAVLTPAVLLPYLDPILTGLFGILGRTNRNDPSKLAENDHVMKAILRTLITVRAEVRPMATGFLERLTAILGIIAERPSNPHFNHYLFESLSAIVRFGATSAPESVTVFENALFPVFQKILQNDITEFMPYVFQILAQLLELQEGVVSAAYMNMLPPIMMPVLWEQHGNVPSLSRLLRAFISKASSAILAQNLLVPILGIFQRLVLQRALDHEGFALLAALLQNMPPATLQPYWRDVLLLLLRRLSESRTPKLSRAFAKLLFTYIARTPGGAVALFELFGTVQPGLFQNVFQSVVLPETAKTMNPMDRKVTIVGLVSLVCNCPPLLAASQPLVASLLGSLAAVIMTPDDASGSASEAEDTDYGIGAEYQAIHAPLSMAMQAEQDPLETVSDPKGFAGRQLAQFAATNGPAFQALVTSLPPAAAGILQALMAHAPTL